jgi:hypothetical protein
MRMRPRTRLTYTIRYNARIRQYRVDRTGPWWSTEYATSHWCGTSMAIETALDYIEEDWQRVGDRWDIVKVVVKEV